MGLFNIPIINKDLSSLFRRKTSQDELVQNRKNEAEEAQQDVPKREEEPATASTTSTAASSTPSKPTETKDNSEEDLEDAYMKKSAHQDSKNEQKQQKQQKQQASASSEGESAEEASEEEEEENNDEDVSMDVEEKEKKDSTTANAVEDEESKSSLNAQERNEQTILVKNVPNACVTDRKALRQLKKLFGPDIDSLRFRSIAMSEMLPRKVAIIQQKLHPARDAVNCYIVYKNKDRMYEVLQTMNCTEFMGHHLLIDSASKPREQVPKRSVFIGNLPFEATEEQLYQHFSDCGPIENLRIVRDRKFNVGKGFAYIQFDDVSTVQIALLKNGQQFDGRELRVTRCSAKETKKSNKHKSTAAFKDKQTSRSMHGDPKKSKKDRKPKSITTASGMIMEGARAKEGDAISLGRKRKEKKKFKPRK